MNPMVLQLFGSLLVASVSAWFGGWLGVRHALRKLRNEKAFERRLAWYEDTVAVLVTTRDLCFAYAVATRQRDAALLGQLVPQLGSAFQVFGEKSNKVALYAPVRTVQRFDGLIKNLLGLAPGFIQSLERGQLYEEFAKNVDGLVVPLNQLIFDLAQEVRVELGMEKITLSDVQNERDK